MSLQEKLNSGQFVVTADVIPPKGTAVYKILQGLEVLKGRVAGINAADMPGANMRAGSLAVCVKIKEMGLEPILQIVCRDRNRISIQSEFLSAYILGIRNVLCLGGDKAGGNGRPNTMEVFDLDSPMLLKTARELEAGFDLGGNRLDGAPKFCLGAALDPGAENQEEEIKKAHLKAEAGTEFFQTQPVFEIEPFINFLEKVAPLDVPILAGVFVLRSAAMARFVNRNIPGITVPESIIRELEDGDTERKSIDITIRIIKEIVKVCSGVHIMMTVHWHNRIPYILNEVGI